MSTPKRTKKAKAEKAEPTRGRGRPTDFRPEFCQQVEKLCRLGATDEQVAAFFDKDVSTINRWKLAHPEFCAAIKGGKIEADLAVANSLFKKATGYVIETERVIGKGEAAKVVKLNIAVEADTTACIFWLKNRAPEQWRDKIDHAHSGTIVHKHEDRVKRREEIIARRREERANGAGAPVH